MFSNFSGIRENLHRYIETRFVYYKLVILEKASRVITSLLSGVVVTLLVFLFLVLFSVAMGLFIGSALDANNQNLVIQNYAWGMLIVGGFYLVLGLILFSMRVRIFSPGIIKSLAKALFEEEEKEEE